MCTSYCTKSPDHNYIIHNIHNSKITLHRRISDTEVTIAWVKIRWWRKLSNEWRIDPGAICLPGGFNYNYNYITSRISDTEVTIAWVKIRKQFACQGASMARRLQWPSRTKITHFLLLSCIYSLPKECAALPLIQGKIKLKKSKNCLSPSTPIFEVKMRHK